MKTWLAQSILYGSRNSFYHICFLSFSHSLIYQLASRKTVPANLSASEQNVLYRPTQFECLVGRFSTFCSLALKLAGTVFFCSLVGNTYVNQAMWERRKTDMVECISTAVEYWLSEPSFHSCSLVLKNPMLYRMITACVSLWPENIQFC